MPSVLLVCTANICRSPMVEALLRARVETESEDWRIESAGTWGMDGRPAANRAQLTMEGRGLDISSHRARTVNSELLRKFNLILTMENGHKEALRAEFPHVAQRIYLLSEMIGQNFEIKDPIQGPLSDFEDTANEFEHIVYAGFDRIRSLATHPIEENKI